MQPWVRKWEKQPAFDNAVPLRVQLTLKALSGNLLCCAFILFQLAGSVLLKVGLKEEKVFDLTLNKVNTKLVLILAAQVMSTERNHLNPSSIFRIFPI